MPISRTLPLPCIQIAGVHDLEEALLLHAAGVHAVGLPLRLPVNAEDLTEAQAAALVHQLPQGIIPVGITYIDNAAEAADFCHTLGIHHLQLHGPISQHELATLRRLMPHICILKSLVVRPAHTFGHSATASLTATASSPTDAAPASSPSATATASLTATASSPTDAATATTTPADNRATLLHEVQTYAPLVDAFITDTFNPATGASGATGMTHDWAASRALVEHSPRPVILAGGLNPGNVYDAIRAVGPAGVDAHTGVEGPDGRKSPTLVEQFVREALRGFAI